ncbi:MAG: ComEC/Rec2 family competence protein [Acidimicrobiales bacterium]
MSDLAAVVLALSAAAGAWMAAPSTGGFLPLLVAGSVASTGLALRRPALLCVGVALATSGLAARSWAGLHPPADRTWSGVATLVTDPARVSGAMGVVARVEGKRVQAWARGSAANELTDRLAGERVRMAGRLGPLPETTRTRLAYRHVAAQLSVERVDDWAPGNLPSRWANGIRRTLLAGTSSFPADRRALFAGFVLGDGREEAPEVADDFRASGLAHLLVVSGENVVFVLGLFAPLMRRLGLRGRLVLGLAVLGLFGVLTRWEPSVLRAEAMAALALVASTLGRPASGLRILALAVTGLLLVDPLLITSLGFGLSVGACAGIAVFSRPLTSAIPGPRSVASAVGVSLAAQAGVAPLLVPAFGSIPLVTIPANLIAVPAAGPLTAWGMAAGIPAGVAARLPPGTGGGVFAAAVHVPTRLLLAWVATVARHAATAPLGRLTTTHLVVLGVGLAVAGLLTVHRRRWMAVVGVVVAGAVTVPALAPGPLDGRALSPGARLWRRGGATVVVVDGARRATDILAGLHAADVSRIDVVVVCRPGPAAATVVGPLLRRFPPRLLLAPAGSTLAGAVAAAAGQTVAVGPLRLTVDAVDPRLVVRLGPAAPQAEPAPGDAAPG